MPLPNRGMTPALAFTGSAKCKPRAGLVVLGPPGSAPSDDGLLGLLGSLWVRSLASAGFFVPGSGTEKCHRRFSMRPRT